VQLIARLGASCGNVRSRMDTLELKSKYLGLLLEDMVPDNRLTEQRSNRV